MSLFNMNKSLFILTCTFEKSPYACKQKQMLQYHSNHWQTNMFFFQSSWTWEFPKTSVDQCLLICLFSYKQMSEEHQSLRYRAVLMWDPWFTVTLGRSLSWMAGFRAKPYGHSLPLDIFPVHDTGSSLCKVLFLFVFDSFCSNSVLKRELFFWNEW